MKIDIVDKIIEQDIFTHRICKIKYSFAYDNYLKNKFLFLAKNYNVYEIEDLFLSDKNINKNSKFKKWSIGLLKNFLGLIPNYGAVLTIIFSISDTISFLKISDLETLKEKLWLKEKPRKKYKKIKNILIIKNVSYLTLDDIRKVHFIQKLIEQKYIVNTLLIICEPLDFLSDFSVNDESEYQLLFNNTVLQNNLGFSLNENCLKLINVLGIEYAEYIKDLNIDSSSNNGLLVNRLITNMLQKAGYNEEENLMDFLKLCSLLFDTFDYDDVEKVSGIKNICCEKEIRKTLESKIFVNDIPNEYRFFVNFVRKYYQNNAQYFSSNIKKQILEYLKEKYPKKYTDLALASIIAGNSNEEKISFCLKALYYEKDKTALYKRNEIILYLSKVSYFVIKIILQLDDIYYSLDYSHENVKNLCMQGFYGLIDLDFLSTEDKLICLSNIAKVSYELMDQSFLLKIDALYRKLLRNIRISTTYNQYVLFILDYIVFSTCIEGNFETSQVVQRLVLYLQKAKLSLHNQIKYSRIGNALFYNDYGKGLELTKKAYDLSDEYILEHQYSTINYSCSLGMCGDYQRAEKILINEFKKTLFKKNAISVSATNNYIIVSYLNKTNNIKWLLEKLLNLYEEISDSSFSDQQIIYNNLLAAYIAENSISNNSKIRDISKCINDTEKDLYHLFYMHQNMMIYYFLNGDADSFTYERSLCNISGLLSPYSNFFKAKADFLEDNINKNWNIQQLQTQLVKWGEKYPEKKYSLYKNSILFGFIERWFE